MTTFTPDDNDNVVGWDSNIGKWFTCKVDSDRGPVVDHDTYRDAMAHLIATDPHTPLWQEQNGGGIIDDSLSDPHEEYANGWEGEDW